MKKFLSLSIALSLSIVVLGQEVSITSKPNRILVEQGETKQTVNFDFLVTNNSPDTLTLTKLMVSVLDGHEKVIHTRFLDNNGVAPSIHVIPNGKFEGASSRLIFNPFTDFSLTMPLTKLVFEWTFTDNAESEVKIKSVVTTQKYRQKENFQFPLKGKSPGV